MDEVMKSRCDLGGGGEPLCTALGCSGLFWAAQGSPEQPRTGQSSLDRLSGGCPEQRREQSRAAQSSAEQPSGLLDRLAGPMATNTSILAPLGGILGHLDLQLEPPWDRLSRLGGPKANKTRRRRFKINFKMPPSPLV